MCSGHYTKRNCILVQNKLEYFFLYQGKKRSYSWAITSIFNADRGKKKRFIGLIYTCFWYKLVNIVEQVAIFTVLNNIAKSIIFVV